MIPFAYINQQLPRNPTERPLTSSEKARNAVAELLEHQTEIMAADLAEALGIKKDHASKYLREIVASGFITRREFSVRRANDSGNMVTFKEVYFRLTRGER